MKKLGFASLNYTFTPCKGQQLQADNLFLLEVKFLFVNQLIASINLAIKNGLTSYLQLLKN